MPEAALGEAYPGYRAAFFGSGTQALAAALIAASRARPGAREVILPAYGCPDLVAATLYAGLRPVLVDLEPDRPWLSLAAVEAALGEGTLAVVAVHLFGVPERVDALAGLCESAGCLLIEDAAQFLPGPGHRWTAPLVVLSFGRGKPVTVLGGGAVLAASSQWLDALPEAAPTAGGRVAFALKARLFNAMLAPRLYWLPESLPFLGLGETRYTPLAELRGLDQVSRRVLVANLDRGWRDERVPAHRLQAALAADPGAAVVDLPAVTGTPVETLLRYPLLARSHGHRADLLRRLRAAGLGASGMYPATLPGIEGVPRLVGDARHGAAEDFAARVLTLPVHELVTGRDVAGMVRVIAAASPA